MDIHADLFNSHTRYDVVSLESMAMPIEGGQHLAFCFWNLGRRFATFLPLDEVVGFRAVFVIVS